MAKALDRTRRRRVGARAGAYHGSVPGAARGRLRVAGSPTGVGVAVNPSGVSSATPWQPCADTASFGARSPEIGRACGTSNASQVCQWPSLWTPASLFYQVAPEASFLGRAVGWVTRWIHFSSPFDQSFISLRKSLVAKIETMKNGINKINGSHGDLSSSKLPMMLTVSTPSFIKKTGNPSLACALWCAMSPRTCAKDGMLLPEFSVRTTELPFFSICILYFCASSKLLRSGSGP